MAVGAALIFVYFFTLLSCLLQTLLGMLLSVKWIYIPHMFRLRRAPHVQYCC
jgi:hypothetical protein